MSRRYNVTLGGLGNIWTPKLTDAMQLGDSMTPALTSSGVTPYYSSNSVWNKTLATLYPSGVPVHSNSATFMSRVLDGKGITPQRNYLGSDATQSTLSVYFVNNSTPIQTVRIWDSWRFGNDNSCDGTFQVNQDVAVPMPPTPKVVGDSDYQIVILNTDTGEEWNFWKVGHTADQGSQPGLSASNVWQPYDIGGGVMRYTAISCGRYQPGPANGTSGGVGGYINGMAMPSNANNPKQWNMRGAKVPYTTGLVRKAEVDAGVILHALAWAYRGPSPDFISPAMGSDGGNFGGVTGLDLPEGARIFLRADFNLNLFAAGLPRILGKALQDYGAILIDNSNWPKMYLESTASATWGSDYSASMLSPAALSDYRVVDWTV